MQERKHNLVNSNAYTRGPKPAAVATHLNYQEGRGEGGTVNIPRGTNHVAPSSNAEQAGPEVEVQITREVNNYAFFSPQWRKITTNSKVISWIQCIKLPFSKQLNQINTPKTQIPPKELGNYNAAITDLLIKGAISECKKVNTCLPISLIKSPTESTDSL